RTAVAPYVVVVFEHRGVRDVLPEHLKKCRQCRKGKMLILLPDVDAVAADIGSQIEFLHAQAAFRVVEQSLPKVVQLFRDTIDGTAHVKEPTFHLDNIQASVEDLEVVDAVNLAGDLGEDRLAFIAEVMYEA